MLAENELPLLADKLKPYIVPWLPKSSTSGIGGGGGSLSTHDIGGSYHSGTLRSDQAPQFALLDGSRAFTGNIVFVGAQTVDGVDLSGHVADANAHHAQATAGTLISLSGQQVSLANGSSQYQIPVTGATPFTPVYTALSSFAGSGLAFSAGFNIGQGDGILVNANDIAVRRYVDSGLAFGVDGGLTLGTPIAVSISTTSVVTASQHGHAVISSSNPGAAASLLATSAGGTLTLNNAGSTSTPALVIGDGSTGRLAIGSSGWRDNATQLEMLGSRTLYVGSNPVGGAAWSIDAAGQVSAAAGDGTIAHVFGQGTIGLVGAFTGYFGVAATPFATTTDYALMQSATNGNTFLNAPSGQGIYHRIANGDVMTMTSSRLNPGGSVLKDLGDYNRKWRTLYAAELYVETLVAQDVISTIGGRIMVAPTTTLIADLTNVATTIDVKHNNLVSGDYVYMASAPGGVAQVESMKVTSGATTITGGYRYTVTRNQDGSGANSWVAGDAVADIGGAVGSGYIDLTASSTLHGHLGPTMTIYSRTSTAAWNGVKPTVSVGNLRSFVDYSSDTFGIAHGNDLTLTPTSGFSGITSDNSNGLRLFNTSLNLYTGGNQFLKLDTTTGFTIKSGTGTSLPTSSIYGAMWYRDTLGGNKAAYIASVYDTTNPTTALRGNNLFVTSYDSPAGPSQLNIIAIDEGNAFVDMAQISMRGGKPTLSMTSNIALQAKTVTATTGARSLVLDQAKAAFNQNVEIGTTLTVGTVVTALTSTVQDAILLRHNSGLTPANGLGVGISASIESSTTDNRLAGRLSWKWTDVLDASRKSKIELSTYYIATEYVGLSATKDTVSLLVDNLDKLQITATTMTSYGQIIKTGVAGQYETLRLGGGGAGVANSNYITFCDQAGTTRHGFVGLGSTSNYNVHLTSDLGDVVALAGNGSVTVGASGTTSISQTSTTAAAPTLLLTQPDVSEEFIEFSGTVAAGNPIDTAALGSYYGKVRVSVNGTFKWLALYN